MDDDARDREISAALDGGFLPPDPDALDAAIRTMRLLALIAVEHDTVDELVIELTLSFQRLVSALLPMPGYPAMPCVLQAGLHARTIATLLTFLNLKARHPAGQSNGVPIESAQDVFERWLDAIVEVCHSKHVPPWHLSPSHYVTCTAATIAGTVPTLREEPWLSLDPGDPRLRVRQLRDLSNDETSADAACELVWCAASALCISACTTRDFRLGDNQTHRPPIASNDLR
jgi:hypothetical protein